MPPFGEPVLRVIAMPADTNPAGDIFGGWLMGLMDLAGASVATRRARGRVATVAAEAMSFLAPVKVGDEVSLHADITRIGRSSIGVHVEAWRRERAADDAVRVTEATFTFVALDPVGRPRALPPES
jgi:acyl-CoA thioesterase YciA